MGERRKVGVASFTLPLLKLLIGILIAFIISALMFLWQSVAQLGVSVNWRLQFINFQIAFIGLAVVVLLALMYLLLQRAIGALQRLEETLDKIIAGDFSLRLNVREQDFLKSLVNKINKIIDLAQKNQK
ncbi:MAG: hypothetical protein N2606_01955 [Candidatus Omnitrophica bacterium]|nr:hypothetical protein [Candidatus Omnitrophota bacterium]